MALFDNELDQALSELIKQWNVAERRIKKAEQVRGNEVVASAIFELRYAGRKMIDVFELALKEDITQPGSNRLKALSNIADATEDCVKSKHDSIDSMLDFIVRWFNDVENKLSLTKINQYFPEYLDVLVKIIDIQDKIAESRQNRTSGRDGIYDEIEVGGYDDILSLFNRMSASKDRVEAEIRKEKRGKIASFAFNVVMAVIAVASLYYGWAGWAATQTTANNHSSAAIVEPAQTQPSVVAPGSNVPRDPQAEPLPVNKLKDHVR